MTLTPSPVPVGATNVTAVFGPIPQSNTHWGTFDVTLNIKGVLSCGGCRSEEVMMVGCRFVFPPLGLSFLGSTGHIVCTQQ